MMSNPHVVLHTFFIPPIYWQDIEVLTEDFKATQEDRAIECKEPESLNDYMEGCLLTRNSTLCA